MQTALARRYRGLDILAITVRCQPGLALLSYAMQYYPHITGATCRKADVSSGLLILTVLREPGRRRLNPEPRECTRCGRVGSLVRC
jgi:hypothetical protein